MSSKLGKIDQSVSNETMVKIISQHEVFHNLPHEEMKQLNSIVSFRSVKAKEIIFEIDDLPSHIFYLLNGGLTLNFPDNSKLDIIPNELIGEIGVLNGDFRLGRLEAKEDSSLIAISTTNLFNPSVITRSLCIEIIRRLSKRVTNYLRSRQQISSKEMILSGEGEHLEFKSTLRWNLKANRKDEKITHAVLKTIAAFLNTDGGTLIIGVADDGEIVGLEHDSFENDDKLLLFLTSIIKSRLGLLHLDNIHYRIEKIQAKNILRVDVQASSSPCYLSNNNLDQLYIRTGPSTTDLRLRLIYDYVKKRFG